MVILEAAIESTVCAAARSYLVPPHTVQDSMAAFP